MSSAKTERLVNLTMALLASPRYIQKSEIFRRVAGYSGTQETKERMFERDKDDLRSLGIDIEVATHDPLFEDEPGYRIKPEKFQLPIQTFTREELSVLATALGMWSQSSFTDLAANAVRRLGLRSNEFSSLSDQYSTDSFNEDGLVELFRALASRSAVTFEYRKDGDSKALTRTVNPLGVSGWHGNWYLVGEDLNRKDIRVFKLSRVTSRIDVSQKRASYEIPADFDVRDYLIMYSGKEIEIEAVIRKGSGQEVRQRASRISDMSDETLKADWDLITYHAEDEEFALREALWFSDSLVVVRPESLRLRVIESLRSSVDAHG